jgi:hypothetical protein
MSNAEKGSDALVAWRVGTDGVVAIYKKRAFPAIMAGTILSVLWGALVWLYLWLQAYIVGLCVGVVMAMLPFLLECRRAVIFTAREVIFRRNTGGLDRIPLAEILGVEQTSAVYMLGARPLPVPAVGLR